MIYRFEDYELDTRRLELRRGDAVIDIEPLAFSLLIYLVENHDHVATKDNINAHVWGGRIVSEAALSIAIHAARAAINDSGQEQRLIKTAHGKGFRFVGNVETFEAVFKDAAVKSETANSDHVTQTANFQLDKFSIAVLPFADMSPNGDQLYFADGMSEEILNALAKIPQLSVAGRTSSFFYKDKNINIKEIGAALQVAYVLEGSVRKQDEKVRITAQLIRTDDGYHQWSETYDGTLANVFDLQDQVSCAIADELKLQLNIITQDGRLASRLTFNQSAYDLYLRARSNLYGDTSEENYERSFDLLNQALELDPNFSIAWALLSRVRLNYAAYVWTGSPSENFERVLFAANRALEIDPISAEALAVSSQCNMFSGNGLQAYEQAKLALKQQPNIPSLIHNWGHINCQLGYCQRGAEAMKRAIEMDPIYSGYWNNLAVAYQNMAEYDKAEIYASRAIKLGDFAAHMTLAWNAFAKGDRELAAHHQLNLFKALGKQLQSGSEHEVQWDITIRALFGDSKDDLDLVRQLLSTHPQFISKEPTGVGLTGSAHFGLIENFFTQWPKVYFARGNLGLTLWSDFEWARDIRNHSDFSEFAKREGWVDVWEKYGTPLKRYA